MRKGTWLLLSLCLVLVLSLGTVYAGNPGGIEGAQPYTISNISIDLVRVTDLKAKATISVHSMSTVDYVKATVTVQKENRTTGKYYDYGIEYVREEKNSTGVLDVTHIYVSEPGTYRIKVVCEDKVNGVTNVVGPEYSYAVGL